MTKKEIIAKIEILKRRVKTPGRAYSKDQREEMRKEISILSIELGKIKFQEDLTFLTEFERNHADFYEAEKNEIKNQINSFLVEVMDDDLKYILEYKIKSFNSKISNVEHTQQSIKSLKEALSFLERSESIPSSNPYWAKDKEEIQKWLAAKYKSLTDKIDKMKFASDEITSVKRLFNEDSKLLGFVFLTNPIFSSASFFDKGFAIVEQNTKKMYLDFNGEVFKIDTNETEIPKIAIKRPNPDLFPFEEKVDTFRSLYGYKNSNNDIIIPAMYKYASPFTNGFAKVGILKGEWEKYHNTNVTYGLIDVTGKIILHCDFIELGDVYNDIVLYKKHVYSKGYVRTSSFNFDMKPHVSKIKKMT